MNKNSPSEAKWMEMDNVMLSKARNAKTKQQNKTNQNNLFKKKRCRLTEWIKE